ncbi:UDP-N-acetylglucosamine 2-epimerase [Nicoletella semolina]|uniref:UDP-N-acetylglucosamine 2-epimerase n=1 Tax=Nicoletella semolina TaxID=271160 RepID=A0A4R2N6D0_9PAST|nr:UDP-N-acetylglucosamine 2-epimerase (non-hydrolyzing) [Nicoletella semolina]MDH2925283.1 UDP-N-acetyl glucosamine 2-epimerase [Nicoletella semolina]TCP16368.1 UDP-N-acetylglucosamine 2-epimerase [Nicoletella semolina]
MKKSNNVKNGINDGKKRLLFIFGTRPEAIKIAPLVQHFLHSHTFETKICVTAQHRQMLDQVLEVFDIQPDFDLNLMQSAQTLGEMTARMLLSLENVLADYLPNLVIVHGDTATAFAASLACYYQKIPVAHIEAGLRTDQRDNPFPEEANRRLIGLLADYHFAPTAQAQQNLLGEGIAAEKIWVTGNTVIDALFQVVQKITENSPLATQLNQQFSFLDANKKLLLVTSHRRENMGQGIEQICQALKRVATSYPQVQIVYPVHLNPQIVEPVQAWLSNVNNIFLIEPQAYLPFVYLMKRAYLILTDSGGIQEEAPALGTPVLLMRETSERPETLDAGVVRLVGTDTRTITQAVGELLENQQSYQSMCQTTALYGDGRASERIFHTISEILNYENR